MVILSDLRINLMVLCVVCLFFSGCSNQEIRDLQASVQRLDTRVQSFQQVTANDTAETASSLGQMTQEMSNAFRDIRYAQSNLSTQTQSLANRLATMEAEVESLKTRMGRLDNFSSSSAQETLVLKQNQETTQKQINNVLSNLQQDIVKLQQENANLRSSVSSIDSSQKSLSSRIESMQANNQEVFRKILAELGASSGGGGAAAENRTQNASGNVHTV